MILEQVGKRVPTFTICCHLIASLTYLILMMPYGLTQSTDKLYTVEPTPALNLQEKDLTTVLLVSHESNDSFGRFHSLRPEVGLLTSTARTFIQSGVTTEYATQVVGTTLDNGRVYAQYLKKSSRVLYEGASFPAVVTSWVGDSTNLPQSHNDLYNADRADWQDQDDRLRKVFVGNTDFVGDIYEKHIKDPVISVISTPLPSFLSESSTLKTFAVNHISRNGDLDENAKKLAAQKVLPIADLPTYTVKNNFSPSGFSWSGNGKSALNKNSSKSNKQSAFSESRIPKQYYQLRAQNGESEIKKPLYMSELLQTRRLATTTYYGFADFTTIVGDSVIVFSPSSSSQAIHVGQVTSIKGEATLNNLNLPHVSYVPITASEDLIVPSSTQEYQQEIPQTTSQSSLLEASLSTPSEIFEDISSAINSISVKNATPSLESSISISGDRVEKITSALSTPSDEEVSAIFHLLQKKVESSKIDLTKNIQSHNTEHTIHDLKIVSVSEKDTVSSSIEPTSVPTLGGATTIFFEEDPFANFIDPSSSVVEPTLTNNQEVITDKGAETTVHNIITNSTLINNSSTDILSSSTEPPPSLQSTYSIVSTIESIQLRQSIPFNPTTISSGVIIKELLDDEAEILDETECLHTSQVFLTQLPKVITYLTTHFTSVDSSEISASSSVETNIINTFDIIETTKNYCIQPTSVSDVMESTQSVNAMEEKINQLLNNSIENSTKENQMTFDDQNITEYGEDTTTTRTTTTDIDVELSSGDGEIDEDDESVEEFELIYKTLYTTYTYLTTIFQESSSSILSHTEVITNVVTSTLGEIETSAFEELDAEIMPTATSSSINKYTVLNNLDSIIRKEEDSFEERDNSETSLLETPLEQSEDFELKTFHTTYTYFTTIFTEGETDVISRTEVLTNIIRVKPTETYNHSTESLVNGKEDNNTYISKSLTQTLSEHGGETVSAFPLNYSTMIRNVSLSKASPVFEDFTSITLVTDVRSSSSNGEGHVINDTVTHFNNRTSLETLIDDQISSESNTEIFPEEIAPSATLLLQTSFTTFTYYTTMYNNNLTNVISRLETITNVVTETLNPSAKTGHIDEATLPVTYFTTFTYWTKLAKDGVISTLSREETISNIVTPTNVYIEDSSTSTTTEIESLKESASSEEVINTNTLSENTFVELATKTLEPTTYYTTYTYYTTSYESDKTITHSRFETVTNILTPTVTSTTDVISTQLESSKSENDSMRENEENLSSKTELLLYDYKKIIDSDGVSTLFFETQVIPSINENGNPVEITRSTSSLYIDEQKKNAMSTPFLSLTVNAEGSSVPVRQYKTGLVRLIEGTRIGNHTTTLYQSRVIGTLIENRYAQIIESTSSFLFEKLPSLTSEIVPSKTLNNLVEATKKPDENTLNLSSDVLESSIGDSTDTPQQLEDESTKQPEDVESGELSDKDDQQQQSKKRTFTPVIRPFASRNRPQFAPKKKTGFPSSATIITRSDFTPTITVTPALKSTGRFSSLKKNAGSSVSGSSSRRFGRPSKISVGQSLSTAPNSSSFGGGRNRFAVSSRGNSALGTSIRRPVSRSSVGVSASFRPGFSSGYNSNARFRIKPTAAFAIGQTGKPTDLTTISQDSEEPDEEDSTQEQINEEDGETTTENSRRNQNPLLRFRRPLSRPNDIATTANQRGLSAGSNNLVSTRRNPLTARSKASISSTSTTTTTPRSRPRGFQRPTIAALSGRQRPQSSLFPPRGLFQAQKQEEVSKNSELDGSAAENADGEDDIEYDDDEGDDTENDGPERKRRSHTKLQSKKNEKKSTELQQKSSHHQNRSKREADVSYSPRSNFRSRFRRPKTASSASADERKVEEEETPETSTVQSASRPGRINSRFGIKQYTQLSSTASTTAVAVSHRGIRPTRPNNGRAQFTLREKDISSTTKSYQRHNAASFRRPQTTASSRRSSSSISNNRRLKTYANNNIGTEALPRSGSTASRMRGSSLNSGRNRSSPPRGRNRNDFNVDVVSNIFDGTITVTHVMPSEVTIPVINGQLTEYKNVITAKTSTEVIGPQQYTSYVGTNGQSTLVLTREESTTNVAGATEITQFILHESPTTTITFTPTTIRGRKTSFSHILPSTVYSVEKLVSTVQPQLANAPLANILLSQLLLGNIGLPGQAPANPLLGAITQPIIASQMPLSPVTEYRTHTSTYVTTIFEGMSTVVPVTFQAIQSFQEQKTVEGYKVLPKNDKQKHQGMLVNAKFKKPINIGRAESRIEVKSNEETETTSHTDESFDIAPTSLSESSNLSKSLNYSGNWLLNSMSPNSENFEEARYNLATRIMSNGVEVIIAGDKSKVVEKSIETSQNLATSYYELSHPLKKPVTLAPSTLKNQMILLVPTDKKENITIPLNTNHFVTKTCLTTYTYRTTYLQNGKTTVESREKVVANVATEERNYPKISSTLSMGITLTHTPQLAVGVFPTTFSYFYTVFDGETSMMMTSDHTVLNTITAPEDFISFLQPSESATPIFDTNTYFNTIVISKTVDDNGIEKEILNPETLTQVIVTESLPARSTSVLTSYYALDVDETLNQAFPIKGEHYSTNNHIDTAVLSTSEYDMHIYATKNFLTTFTYLTTTTVFQENQESQGVSNSNNKILPVVTTVVNYQTRIIENVITESIPASFIRPELMTKFRKELKRGKNQRSSYVTLATLLGGQTLEITAIKMMTKKSEFTSQEHSSTVGIYVSSAVNNTQKVPIRETKIEGIPQETVDMQLTPSKRLNSSISPIEKDSTFESSDPKPTFIAVKPEKHKISTQLPPNINNIFGSLNLDGLTVLKPVFNAVADLIQSKFVSNADMTESKNSLRNISADFKIENAHDPIYIPVQNPLDKSKNTPLFVKIEGIENSTLKNQDLLQLAPPQSLHIKPPDAELTISDDNWMQVKYNSDRGFIRINERINLPSQQPLINGGIPIRPGEVITTNSDVIVGKPNGIQQPKVYTLQSNIIPLRRGNTDDSTTSFTASKNVPYYKQITHSLPHQENTEHNNHKHTTVKTTQNYDNILKPPPLSPISLSLPRLPFVERLTPFTPVRQHSVEVGPKTTLSYSWDHESKNNEEHIKYFPKLSKLNNELRNNEIIEIKRIPQVFSTDIIPDAIMQTTNTLYKDKILNQKIEPPQNQLHLRLSSPYNSTLSQMRPDPKTSRDKTRKMPVPLFQDNLKITPISRPHSNHQRINLRTNVLNHNIAINVPPLTFKNESELATPVFHGIPSTSQLFMPHIKIPANKVEVQVNLTPIQSVSKHRDHFNYFPDTVKFSPLEVLPLQNREMSTSTPAKSYQHTKMPFFPNWQELQAHPENSFDMSSNPYTSHAPKQNKVKAPNIALPSKFHLTTAPTTFSNTKNIKHDTELSKEGIATQSDVKTTDQTAAYSSTKNQLLLSKKTNFEVLNQSNHLGTLPKTKKPFPLLSPLTASEVNRLDGSATSSKNNDFTKLQSNHKSSTTGSGLNNYHDISLTTSNNITELTEQKQEVSFPDSRNNRVPQAPKPLPLFEGSYNNQSKPMNPNLLFSQGQPFEQKHRVPNTTNKFPQDSYGSHNYNNVFIATGQGFKLSQSSPHSNTNISHKINKIPGGNFLKPTLSQRRPLNRQKENPTQITKPINSNTSTTPLASKPSKKSNTSSLELLHFGETNNVSKNNNLTAELPERREGTRNKQKINPELLSRNHDHQRIFTNSIRPTTDVVGLHPPPLFRTSTKKIFSSSKNVNETVALTPTHVQSSPIISISPFSQFKKKNQNNERSSNLIPVINNNDQTWNHLVPETSNQKKNISINHKIQSTPFLLSSNILFSKSSSLLQNEIEHTSIIFPSLVQSFSSDSTQYTDKSISLDSKNVLSDFERNPLFKLETSMDSSDSLLNLSNEKSTNILYSDEFSSANAASPQKTTTKTQFLSQKTQPTKFKTNTVTMTKTTILTKTVTNEKEKDRGNSKMTTFLLTTTFTTTVVDTVTETQTLIQPTRITEYQNFIHSPSTTESTLNEHINTPKKDNYSTKSFNNFDSSYEFNRQNGDDVAKENTSKKINGFDNKAISAVDRDNIFIVMTNKQGHSNVNTNLDTTEIYTDEDYYDHANLDIATRDEELFLGSEDSNKILFGGVLIATSTNFNILNTMKFDMGSTGLRTETEKKDLVKECKPACKTSRNELCKSSGFRYQCVCRPGFARMFPDRPCKPTYTYTMQINIKRIGDYPLVFNNLLGDTSSKDFREIATMTRDAIDRMVMQSDLRDIYHGVSVESFSTDDTEDNLIVNILLQFSDSNDERRLEDVFKKYLRMNGYNIGGTELYTDQKGTERITVMDFNECNYPNFNDCSSNASCFNLKGTYTCSCRDGYIDLSENSVFPGRLCSAEVIGCEKCYYHGQCVSQSKEDNEDLIVCECFTWYAGSMCQLNLKILLIVLMAVGTILFIILLICILLACMKQREPKKAFFAEVFSEVQSQRPKQSDKISLRLNTKEGSKATYFLKKLKSDNSAMIMDTTSESSDSSLPYVLKDQYNKPAVYNFNEKNKLGRATKESFKSFPMKKQKTSCNPNYYVKTGENTISSTLGNFQGTVFTEIEQSDRSLTVMIPRARYHHSVLPETKLMHHQLTLERTNASIPKSQNEPQTELRNAKQTKKAENTSHGALVSAGFEVSAIVNDNLLCLSNESSKAIMVTPDRFGDTSYNYTALDSHVQDSGKQFDIAEFSALDLNKEMERECHTLQFNACRSVDSSGTIDGWFDSMQQTVSSTGEQIFDEPKGIKSEPDDQTINTNEEANTMAERDIGSTFLLPHTHLYKPERESDISCLESI